MSEKANFFSDEESYNKIMNTKDPAIIKKLGRKVKNFNSKKWSNIKEYIVIKCLIHKVKYCEELKKSFINTDEHLIVEAFNEDKIWANGLSIDHKHAYIPELWNGKNLMGKCLMKARDIFLSYNNKNE